MNPDPLTVEEDVTIETETTFDYHDAGIPGSIVAYGCLALSGAIVGAIRGFLIGRLTA